MFIICTFARDSCCTLRSEYKACLAPKHLLADIALVCVRVRLRLCSISRQPMERKAKLLRNSANRKLLVVLSRARETQAGIAITYFLHFNERSRLLARVQLRMFQQWHHRKIDRIAVSVENAVWSLKLMNCDWLHSRNEKQSGVSCWARKDGAGSGSRWFNHKSSANARDHSTTKTNKSSTKKNSERPSDTASHRTQALVTSAGDHLNWSNIDATCQSILFKTTETETVC